MREARSPSRLQWLPTADGKEVKENSSARALANDRADSERM